MQQGVFLWKDDMFAAEGQIGGSMGI